MHIFINHQLKRALITHPKVAGTTISNLLDWKSAVKFQTHENIVGWKQIASDAHENYLNLKVIRERIPSEYTTTLLYRDPVKRYISGFNYLIIENLDLLAWESTSGEQRKEFWNKKDKEWYKNFVYQIFKLSGWLYGLNNNHTQRVMLVIWILYWELANTELLYIDNLDNWIRSVHNLPPDFEVPKHNSVDDGYGKNTRDPILLSVMDKFKSVLETHIHTTQDALRDYLELDRKLFKQLRHIEKQQSLKPNNVAISCMVIDSVFNECYSPHDNIMSGHSVSEKEYLHALLEWVKQGNNISDESRELINNKIADIVTRYRHVVKREFDLDV